MNNRHLNIELLESLLISDSDYTPAIEFFGRKEKLETYQVSPMDKEMPDKEFFSVIRISNVRISFPNKQWPDHFLSTWNKATSKFNENGIRVLNDYLKKLQLYEKYAKAHNDEWIKFKEDDDKEGLANLYNQSNVARQPMIQYREHDDTILSGEIETLRSPVRSALDSLLTTFQREYESLAFEVVKFVQNTANQHKSSKFHILKNSKNKTVRPDAGLLSDALTFYEDFLTILKNQHKS